MRPWTGLSLAEEVACRLFGPSTSLGQCWFLVNETLSHQFSDTLIELALLRWRKCVWNHRLQNVSHYVQALTHWGRVTHICVGNLSIIGSDNGLSPGRRQVITWTNVGILLFGPLGTNFSEMLIEIHTFLLKKIHLKMSSGKRRSFCLNLNVLIR